MNLFKTKKWSKWIGYGLALLIIGVTIWQSNVMVQQLKEEENSKMDAFAKNYQLLATKDSLDPEVFSYLLDFADKNATIPVLLVNDKHELLKAKNIDSTQLLQYENSNYLKNNLDNFYPPITIELPFGDQYLYYKNSFLLNKLRYYPYVLIGIIAIFIYFTIWYFRTLKRSEQSFLWSGMAKETAHQIGTPLSSLMGWKELLKSEYPDNQAVDEMEKDIHRLEFITERFSKIGSKPELDELYINGIVGDTFDYLKNRVSSSIVMNWSPLQVDQKVKINNALFSWVLENLIKNAVDSIKQKGTIQVSLTEHGNKIYIDISDDGSGIPPNLRREIFSPGFTTKKRGWGLGLSLAKRIIEEYHKGKIFVLKSEMHKGTTFRIILTKMT